MSIDQVRNILSLPRIGTRYKVISKGLRIKPRGSKK